MRGFSWTMLSLKGGDQFHLLILHQGDQLEKDWGLAAARASSSYAEVKKKSEEN
jgi:hypothetical protein